ncbi:MAG: hypothetical protein H3C47_02535, partial [Candidatus Cloacimonetes bacterium]|nr:hypothetical protein [Candidatus Cloacimonadota bacterium]
IWLSKEDLRALSREATDEVTYVSWFERLRVAGVSIPSDAKELAMQVREIYRLVEEGSASVPGYLKIWEQARGDLSRLAEPIAEALKNPADTTAIHQDQLLPLHTRLVQQVERPFLALNPELGRTLQYNTETHLTASKIWPVFKGLNIRSFGSATFVMDPEKYREGKLNILRFNEKKQIIGTESAMFVWDPRGEVMSLKTPQNNLTPVVQNMVGMFYRGFGEDLSRLQGEKTIYLGHIKGTRRDRVKLDMKIRPVRLVKDQDLPLLEVEMILMEHPQDRGDSLSLSGKGKVRIAPNGVIANIESEVSFRVKMLGLNLVRGSSKDKIALIYP